jgi:hypothetical protein
MKAMVLRIFQREVERQCRLMAADDLGVSLVSGDHDRLWYSIQALLVAAGNVSKLLWPPKRLILITGRGKQLRTSLQVGDDSPLLPRDFRNHFEHFGERLESWAKSSRRYNFVDSNIGSPGSIQGLDVSDFLRNFDPETLSLHFRGDVYHLRPVVQAIDSILKVATVEANKPRAL